MYTDNSSALMNALWATREPKLNGQQRPGRTAVPTMHHPSFPLLSMRSDSQCVSNWRYLLTRAFGFPLHCPSLLSLSCHVCVHLSLHRSSSSSFYESNTEIIVNNNNNNDNDDDDGDDDDDNNSDNNNNKKKKDKKKAG